MTTDDGWEDWGEPSESLPWCPDVVLAAPGEPVPAHIPLEPGPLAAAPTPAPPVEVVPATVPAGPEEEVRGRLRRLEERILEDSLHAIEAAVQFPEALGDAGELRSEPPEAWVAKYGEEEARRRFVYARSACMPSKAAPVGLKMAQQFAVGSLAAMEKRPSTQVAIQLQWVNMVHPQFEEIVLEPEDK